MQQKCIDFDGKRLWLAISTLAHYAFHKNNENEALLHDFFLRLKYMSLIVFFSDALSS